MARIEETVVEGVELVEDVNIGYQRYGNGSNYLLAICGGVGCYKKDWPEHVLQVFDPNYYTIICMDPPGYGTSRPPERQQEVNRCKKDAKFAIGLMKRLGLTPFTVMGWSEGARTGVHVAHQGKPALVSRAILIAATTFVDARLDAAFASVRHTERWLPETLENYVRHYPRDFVHAQWAAICDVVHKVHECFGGHFPSDIVLPSLKQPVLVVYGGMDRFIMNQKQLMAKIPNAREACHAQGGHDFYITYPRWLSIKVTQFFKETTDLAPKASL